MVSAINIIGNDSSLQDHWFKRFIAIVIDNVIFWIIGTVLTIFAFQNWLGWTIPFLWTVFQPILSGGLFFLYAFLMEASSGATLGKKIMNLRVISLTGPLSYSQAAVRNISKIYGPFLFIDWLIGFVSEGDPKQKWLDRSVGSTVVLTTSLSDQQQHTYQSQQAAYAPPPQEGYQRHEQTYQYPPSSPATGTTPTHYDVPKGQPDGNCKSCGGRMTLTGNGRFQCIRCGKIQ